VLEDPARYLPTGRIVGIQGKEEDKSDEIRLV
jgi:hypothetical protein